MNKTVRYCLALLCFCFSTYSCAENKIALGFSEWGEQGIIPGVSEMSGVKDAKLISLRVPSEGVYGKLGGLSIQIVKGKSTIFKGQLGGGPSKNKEQMIYEFFVASDRLDNVVGTVIYLDEKYSITELELTGFEKLLNKAS